MPNDLYRGAMPTSGGTKPGRRPDPEPLETDDRWFVVAGIVLWVVAFVVLAVFFRDDLRRHHSEWWLWSCWIGVALGLYGLRFVSRR
jgi:Protein of unknown function (DUF2530)